MPPPPRARPRSCPASGPGGLASSMPWSRDSRFVSVISRVTAQQKQWQMAPVPAACSARAAGLRRFVRSFIKHVPELGASVLGPGEQWGALTPCGRSPRNQDVLGAAPGPTYRLRACCAAPDRLCLPEPRAPMGNAGELCVFERGSRLCRSRHMLAPACDRHRPAFGTGPVPREVPAGFAVGSPRKQAGARGAFGSDG